MLVSIVLVDVIFSPCLCPLTPQNPTKICRVCKSPGVLELRYLDVPDCPFALVLITYQDTPSLSGSCPEVKSFGKYIT